MSCPSCPLDDLQSLWRNGWVLSTKSCKTTFPTANTLPDKTPDHLEHENDPQKRHSEENVHDELQRIVKTPSDLQRKVAFCPPRRRRAPLLRCNMSDLKSVYTCMTLFWGVGEAIVSKAKKKSTGDDHHYTSCMLHLQDRAALARQGLRAGHALTPWTQLWVLECIVGRVGATWRKCCASKLDESAAHWNLTKVLRVKAWRKCCAFCASRAPIFFQETNLANPPPPSPNDTFSFFRKYR